MIDAVGTSIYTYHGSGNLLTEDGPWASDTVTYGYNDARLRNALTLQQPAGTWSQTYGYDSSRRMNSVTSPAGPFSYWYSSGSTPLVRQVDLPNGSRIVNTFQTQPLVQWMSTELKNSADVVLNKHSYQYDWGGIRRQQQTFTDGTFISYVYDLDDQLTFSTGSAGNYSYSYDAGWNMATRNGGAYTVNDLNQVTSEGGGALNYFYDYKGNRTGRATSTGSLTYTYDAENQLTTVHTDTFYTPETSRWKTEFLYDGKMRLRIRKEYISAFGGWSLSTETRYVYDGMRVIQERNSANTPTVTYTRGLDLSATLEGAGGIGGLLARSHGYSAGSWTTHNFYHSDAGGNVTYMINMAQSMVASYKYDPFGRTISQSGTLANDNVYCFSSKEIHFKNATGGPSELYYYGYRFYDAQTGRWLNRDPLGELGGMNLYRSHANNPINKVDPWGLYESERCSRMKDDIKATRDLINSIVDVATGNARDPVLFHDLLKQLDQQIKECIEEGCTGCDDDDDDDDKRDPRCPEPYPVPSVQRSGQRAPSYGGGGLRPIPGGPTVPAPIGGPLGGMGFPGRRVGPRVF